MGKVGVRGSPFRAYSSPWDPSVEASGFQELARAVAVYLVQNRVSLPCALRVIRRAAVKEAMRRGKTRAEAAKLLSVTWWTINYYCRGRKRDR